MCLQKKVPKFSFTEEEQGYFTKEQCETWPKMGKDPISMIISGHHLKGLEPKFSIAESQRAPKAKPTLLAQFLSAIEGGRKLEF